MTQLTSLAQQLQQLKIKQKDEIKLPSRTKISFLFDIKQAANVDDQTVFYIYQTGLRDIERDHPNLFSQLSIYQNDIFSEKSLEFYRGTQTKEELKSVEEKLQHILNSMAPYLLDSSTHKVLEYLIRIYDIHAFHKETLVYAFFPYFETAYFIKAIQIVNLKQEDNLGFLEQFAFTGQALDKNTFIKNLARNDALLFAKYAAYCFNLQQIHSSLTQNQSNLHWKFFGAMLVEILRLPNTTQTTLFNLLPYISQGLKSQLSDLKVASLLAISQLVCRKSLTVEYSQAFFKQVLIAMTDSTDDIVKKCLLTLELILKYQNQRIMDDKDVQKVLNVPRIGRIIQDCVKQHDILSLITNLTQTSLVSATVDLKTLFKSVLIHTLNQRVTNLLIEVTIVIALQSSQVLPSCRLLLNMLRDHNQSWFNTGLMDLINKSKESKDQILGLLSDQESSQIMFAKFGDKEYSLLSAMNSQQKVTKINALKAIKDNAKKLSDNERDLIIMSLNQLVTSMEDEESILDLALDSLKVVIDFHKTNDYLFDTIESVLNQNLDAQRYSESVNAKCLGLLSEIKVSHKCNKGLIFQISQNNVDMNHLPEGFQDIKTSKSLATTDFLKLLEKHKELGQSITNLTLEVIQSNPKYFKLETLLAMIKSTLNLSDEKSSTIRLILRALKSSKFEQTFIQNVINLTLSELTRFQPEQIHKPISTLIGFTLHSKLHHKEINLQDFTVRVIKDIFKDSLQKFAEYILRIATESNNQLKQIFAISNLQMISQERQITPEIMMITSLILLNDTKQEIRAKGLQLMQILQSKVSDNNTKIIQVFTDTPKPKSAKKGGSAGDKQDFTPLKSKPLKSFIKDFLNMQSEITSDRNQLQTCLNNSPHAKLLESIIRFLLDLPSTKMKSKLIDVLLLINQYSFVFSMSLQEQLNKEYHQLKSKPINPETLHYILKIGQLILQICRRLTLESLEEHISSLVFPYLNFVFTLFESKQPQPYELSQTIAQLFTSVIVKENQIHLKSENAQELLGLYVKSQHLIVSKIMRQQIKTAFVSLQADQFIDKEIVPQLNKIADNLSDKQNLLNLEILVDLLNQIDIQNQHLLLPKLFTIISQLATIDKEGEHFFQLEITVQLCTRIVENKRNPKKQLKANMDQLLKVMKTQLEQLRTYVQNQLNSNAIDKNDPFSAFIMEVDSHQQDSETQEFTAIFQTISSVLNFLFIYESKVMASIAHTQEYLTGIAELFRELTQHDKAHSQRGANLVTQVFRFYQAQVIRIIRNAQTNQYDLKLILSQYVDSLLLLQNFTSNIEDLYGYLTKVLALVQDTHLSFIVFVVLAHGKDHISVKDNLQLDSVEIQLIQRIILQQLSGLQALRLIEELLFSVCVMQQSEAYSQFVTSKLKSVFEDSLVDRRATDSQWVSQRYMKDNDSKEIRRLKYLTIFLLENWIANNTSFQKLLASAVHDDGAKSAHQLFYQIYLSASVFNESVSNQLQTKDYQNGDKKAKKSLKRLFGRIQEFQKSFNNILSYRVQVDIILRILDLKDKQTTYLKTQSLQLLINKTPQFSQGLSKIQEKDLTSTFMPLIERSISILERVTINDDKLNTERQNFYNALFSLLSRTFSNSLSQEMKDGILNLSLKYLEVADKFSLIVHSQLILTCLTIFEVQQLNILEHLPRYFTSLMAAYQRLTSSLRDSDFFADSFAKTLLKSTLSICMFFSKFLTASQYEEVIKNVLVLPYEFETEISSILDLISREATKAAGLKLVFQALVNSYEAIILDNGIQNSAYTNLDEIAIRYFGGLLKQVIERMKKDFCQENYKKIFAFFRTAFALSYQYSKVNEGADLPNFEKVGTSIAQAFEQFVIKLNEEQLRPLIVKLTKWAFKGKNEDNDYPYNIHKSVMFFKVLNIVLNSLKEFFVPLFALYLDRVVELLQLFGQSTAGNDKKRKRHALDFSLNEGHSPYLLLLIVCENVRLNFQYDNLAFIQNDTFEKLSDPLAHLVSISTLGSNYMNFVEDHLKPTVFECVERINNDDMWKKINNEILMQTRNTNPLIRLGAFKIIENLYMKIGERYLVLLNDTLPFLSEGMEDESPDVELTARSIVQRIEQMTGDSIHDYLK